MRLQTLSAFLLCSLPVAALTLGGGCGGGSSLPTPVATPTSTATTSPFGTATPTLPSNGTPGPTSTATPTSPLPTRFENDLIFSDSESGRFGVGIFRSDADGGNRRLLVSPSALEQASQGAVIRPGGREVAFYSRTATLSRANLYLMNANGSNIRTIALRAGFPAWSPDGARLVAVNRSNGRLFVCNPDGSGINTLEPQGAPPLADPTFSPDGRSVFATDNSSGSQLYKISLDTEEITTIDTGDISSLRKPRFSADGRTLAFVGYQSSAQRGLYLANPDGSGGRLVPNTSDALRAVWSPGNSLAIETSSGLYSIGRDGSNRRFITSGTDFDWR